MVLFDKLIFDPLIEGLKRMPEQPTLMQFRDELRDLFEQLHKTHPDCFEDTRGRTVGSPLQRLARDFECDPTEKRRPHLKEAGLHGAIRSLPHIIYTHRTIKKELPREGKKILILYRARLQILLAKRLSRLRVMREQREHLLALTANELEKLMSQNDASSKETISDGLGAGSGGRRRRPREKPIPRWERRAMPFHKLVLAGG